MLSFFMSGRERFLFRMLAAIFIVEVGFLATGWWWCMRPGAECTDLGDRSEKLFNTAIATTLSLLAAGNLNVNK